MRNELVAAITALALLLGGGGGYFYQNRAVSSAQTERDEAKLEVTRLNTTLSTRESQLQNANKAKAEAESQAKAILAEKSALYDAVQVTHDPRHVAHAYGSASIFRNQVWIKALMDPALAALHELQPVPAQYRASKYTIESEQKGENTWTYVVRVHETLGGEDYGYTESTLEVYKVGPYYKIKALKVADFVRRNINK